MSQSTDRQDFNEYNNYNQDEIFNGGMCFFVFSDTEDESKSEYKECAICRYEIKTKAHPLTIIRACSNVITTKNAIENYGPRIPSLVKRLGNFAIAYLRHKATGSKEVGMDIIRQRFDMCKRCTLNYDKINRQCKKCGCNVNDSLPIIELNKLAWAESVCPENYWSAVEV
jgi:hypothetical protein